jgi:hypothetical protein
MALLILHNTKSLHENCFARADMRIPGAPKDPSGPRILYASIWTALAWCLGTLVVAYALATVTYRRKIA